MKTLVVYYSRTGLTKKVATSISKELNADIDQIIDKKDRAGAKGYMIAGKDALREALTQISYERNPKDYDLIIIGGPVWAWNISPAVRTYLDNNIDALKIKKVAFFATQGSNGAEKKFATMKNILGITPESTLTINSKDFRNDAYVTKVIEFILNLPK